MLSHLKYHMTRLESIKVNISPQFVIFFNFYVHLRLVFVLNQWFQLVILVNHVCQSWENLILDPPYQLKYLKIIT